MDTFSQMNVAVENYISEPSLAAAVGIFAYIAKHLRDSIESGDISRKDVLNSFYESDLIVKDMEFLQNIWSDILKSFKPELQKSTVIIGEDERGPNLKVVLHKLDNHGYESQEEVERDLKAVTECLISVVEDTDRLIKSSRETREATKRYMSGMQVQSLSGPGMT